MRIAVVLVVLAMASLPVARTRAQDVGPGRGEGSAPAPVVRSPSDVIALLSGFEGAPGLDEWRAIGPSAVPLLRGVASDASLPGFVRLRAVQALAAFPTAEVRTELRRVLRGPEPLMARAAGLALARAFGAAAEDDVAWLLGHADEAVREGAIEALARIGTAGARARLSQRLARERDAALRARIVERLRGGVGSSPDEGEGTR